MALPAPQAMQLALLGLFLAGAVARAEVTPEVTRWPEVSAKIDQLYAAYDQPHTPGGVVAVLHGGEVVHLKGYGAANCEFRVPWTSDTRYRIASVTKSFVAYALLLLEERGQLRQADPLQKYLPDFPTFEKPVTIHHLLTMTSGLWQDEHLLALAGLRGRLTLDEMYTLSRRQSHLNYAPGSSASYVDTNYRLLARILSAVTGKPFPAAMQELVFEPLGMTSTLADPDLGRVFDGQATTYLDDGASGSRRVLQVPFPTSGDGSIVTTLRDMVRWLQHLRGPGAAIFRRMIEPVEVGDGLAVPYRRGIYKILHPAGRIGWGHSGATGTSYMIWPDHDLVVVHFTNNPKVPAERFAQLASDAVLKGRPEISRQVVHRDVEPWFEPLKPRDVGYFSGTFVEPQSGYVLVSEPWLDGVFHSFLGAAVLPTRVADGHYRPWLASSGSRIEVTAADCDGCAAPDLDVRHADWGEPRRFLRVTRQASAKLRLAEYVGHYYSETLGTHYTVEPEDGELVLRIGTGIQAVQTFRMQPLLSDCFLARPTASEGVDFFDFGFLSIRFERDPEGRVSGMRVSIDKVRDLRFRLVH